MWKICAIALGFLLVPDPAHAGLMDGLHRTFGAGGPAEPVAWLVYLSIGRWTIVTVSQTFGNMVFGQGVDLICRCVAVGIVFRTVWKLLDETLGWL
jgi:hypothetical protein